LTLLGGFGAFCTDQALPFQRSTSTADTVALEGKSLPTAVQAEADEHETAARDALEALAGVGALLMDHVVPFHTSPSGTALDASTA
jgi:hypothetical protein